MSNEIQVNYWPRGGHGVLKRISPGQNGRHFADDLFRCIFANEKFCISIRILFKFVPKGFNWQLGSIGSVHPVHRRIYAALEELS